MSVFYHVVMMKFSAAADAAFHDTVRSYGDAIRASCQGLLSYDYVDNAAGRSQGHDHAVLARFVDEAAHDAYQIAPAHVEMKAYMAPFIESMVVLDTIASG